MTLHLTKLHKEFIEFAKSVYGNDFIPLHRPVFLGNEKKYLTDCIDSNFVSSVGPKVTEFENKVAEYIGSKYAIATCNGTASLHVAIQLAGVKPGDEVISQAVTFIATCNAISYVGAKPLFIDVDIDTTGGGGMIFTDNSKLAEQAKHITTTAKVNHPFEFFHDEIGYNYRMPNLNAALGCAQIERLEDFLTIKADVAGQWGDFFDERETTFVRAIEGNKANHWLNTIILKSKDDRDNFLKATNASNVMTRPIWTLMSKLPMFKNCQTDGLTNSIWLEDRVVNIPSSVPNELL